MNVQDFAPLVDRYRGRKHPLDYKNRYQLLVMVLLSARDSDAHINALAPALFGAYPDMAALAKVNSPAELAPYIGEVMGFDNKAKWLITLAKTVQSDDRIPRDLDGLTALNGIGRKSANVIMRESGDPAAGIIVDLHVVRTAPRIGLVPETLSQPEKIEKLLMQFFPSELWGQIGMALSFLGRETCRPTRPHCSECPVNQICRYRAATGG